MANKHINLNLPQLPRRQKRKRRIYHKDSSIIRLKEDARIKSYYAWKKTCGA